MDNVRRDRRALKTNVTRLEAEVAPYDLMPKNEIQDCKNETDQMKNRSKTLLDNCSKVAKTDPEYDAEVPEFTAIDTRLRTLSVKLKDMMDAHGAATSTTAATGSTDVKLPKLELPTFTGEARDWISFQDLFIASVHNNTKLSGAQKLQYLKASLKGEAATLLQNIQITDLNYDGAWDTLKSRYENKREIIKSHFDRLLSLPILTQENPDALRKIGNSTNECIRALEVMKLIPEQRLDLLVIHLMSRKFDTEARLEWERSLKADTIPTLKEFTDFILQQARITAAAGVKSKGIDKKTLNQEMESSFVKKSAVHLGTGSTREKCPLCNKEKHYLNKCEEFRRMTAHERREYVKKTRRCFRCLNLGHRTQECTMNWTCRWCCKQDHHSMIHVENENKKAQEQEQPTDDEPTKAEEIKEEPTQGNFHSVCNMGVRSTKKTLLSTALISIQNNKNQGVVCRALLDNGSQTSFITRKCATNLGLKIHQIRLPISGLGDQRVGTVHEGVELFFTSRYSSKITFKVEAPIMEKITGDLPDETIDVSSWTHIKELQLADQHFQEPGRIEILLGADIYQNLLKTKRIKGPDGTPWAIDSHLGWILQGQYEVKPKMIPIRAHFSRAEFVPSTENYCELEDSNLEPKITPEERKCDEHFYETHELEENGRVIERLPSKEDKQEIGESSRIAVNRLQSMERRLKDSPDKSNENCDASDRAYAAVAYLRPKKKNETMTRLKGTLAYVLRFCSKLNPSPVKSPNFYMKRILEEQPLNSEMMTIVKQIEACLNSRPLCVLSTDTNDLTALTPSHFLIGEPLNANPEPNLTYIKMSRLSRWQMITLLFQHFWRRWKADHMSRIQEKPKWWSDETTLEVGTLVFMNDDDVPPFRWKTREIIGTNPGHEGKVRVVTHDSTR